MVLVRDISDSQLEEQYGILYQQIFPHGAEDLAPWGVGRAVVLPGEKTEPHSHDENELFIFLEGQGVLNVDGQEVPVEKTVATLMPAGSTHYLRNESETDQLAFISVYWPQVHGDVSL